MDVCWALMVEYGTGMLSPAEVEDAYLNGPKAAVAGEPSPATSAAAPSLDTWGTTPEAKRGQDAMIAMLGGSEG